ncbi:MAG: hypothetical protein OXF27_16830, partial [Acidobacteria bacterium]|nr:hypothetical protein [Acidobacteriota bacterium]
TNTGSAPWLARYGMVEHQSAEYPPRTAENVFNADLTVIFDESGGRSGGSAMTLRMARQMQRAVLMNPTEDQLAAYLAEHRPATINVAGNRERSAQGIGGRTEQTVGRAIIKASRQTDNVVEMSTRQRRDGRGYAALNSWRNQRPSPNQGQTLLSTEGLDPAAAPYLEVFDKFFGDRQRPDVFVAVADQVETWPGLDELTIEDAEKVKAWAKRVLDPEVGTQGATVHLKHPVLPNAYVVLVPPTGNVVQAGRQAQVLGHELGHLLAPQVFNEMFGADGQPTAEGREIIAHYRRARNRYMDTHQYTDDAYGLEEFFADQLGTAMTNEVLQADRKSDSQGNRLLDWFRQAARRLRETLFALWTLNPDFEQRARPDTQMQNYVGELRRRFSDPEYIGATWYDGSSQMLETEVREMSIQAAKALPAQTMKGLTEAWRGDMFNALKKVVVPSTVQLFHISPRLGSFFRGRAGTAEGIGYNDQVVRRSHIQATKVERVLGIDGNSPWTALQNPAVQEILTLAEDDRNSLADAKGPRADKARALRGMLEEMHSEMIAATDAMLDEQFPPTNPGDLNYMVAYRNRRQQKLAEMFPKRKNFFPRRLSMMQLQRSTVARRELALLMREYVSDVDSLDTARRMVDEIVEGGETSDALATDDTGDGFSPGMRLHLRRALGEIPTAALRTAGLIEDPMQSLMQYIAQAEGRIAFSNRGGNFELIAALKELPAEKRAEAEHIVRGLLGQLGRNMSPGFRTFNNFAL